MDEALRVEGLCKHYPDFTLDHVDLNLPWGSIMGLIGENGSGKTTAIKSMLRIVAPDGGTVRLAGMDMGKQEIEAKEEIGLVLGENHFHEYLRAKEVGRILGGVYKKWDQELFDEYLKKFSPPEKKKIKDYSKGMKMKLAIAAALGHHPRVLLLDEATSGLDPAARDDILDLLFGFIEDGEHSVLLSSHITSDLEKVADYITMIHEGKVVFSEEKDRMLENLGVVRCGRDQLNRLDGGYILRVRDHAYQTECLVKEKERVRGMYPELVVDDTDIEEIMLFLVKGERR